MKHNAEEDIKKQVDEVFKNPSGKLEELEVRGMETNPAPTEEELKEKGKTKSEKTEDSLEFLRETDSGKKMAGKLVPNDAELKEGGKERVSGLKKWFKEVADKSEDELDDTIVDMIKGGDEVRVYGEKGWEMSMPEFEVYLRELGDDLIDYLMTTDVSFKNKGFIKNNIRNDYFGAMELVLRRIVKKDKDDQEAAELLRLLEDEDFQKTLQKYYNDNINSTTQKLEDRGKDETWE